MSLSPCFPSSGQGFSSGVQQVLSLSCSFSFCRLWCGFLIQRPKVLNHSCPTTVLSHKGHCPLPLPVIVVSLLRWCSLLPLLFLSWSGKQREIEVWREVWDWWKDSKKKEAEKQRGERICQNSSKTLGEAEKAAGSCSWSRWSECVRQKKGGRVMESKVRGVTTQSFSGRESETESGGRDLLFMCVR